MAKDKSVFDLVTQPVLYVLKEKILPYDDWEKELRDKGELMILTLYDKKNTEAFGFKPERFNKDVFLRTSVMSALEKIDQRFEAELFYCSALHSTIEHKDTKKKLPVLVVSSKERIEEHGFKARKVTRPKKTKAPETPKEPESPTKEAPKLE